MSVSRRARTALLLCVLLAAARAATASVTVTNTGDSGAGSLRDAVANAAPGETIVFDASLAGQTITFTGGQILLLKDVTIDGGANRITLSGGGATRIFVVSGATVTLTALTLQDGNDGGQGGGALVNGGTLTMNNCTVRASVASAGGAGLVNAGTLVMGGCTVEGNVATGGVGGGIDNVGSNAHLTMTACTVSGNVAAAGNGGGIANVGAGATATLASCTVARNASSATGGGLHTSEGDASAVHVGASILADNHASASPDCSGSVFSNGYNIRTSGDGCSLGGGSSGDQIADPKLGSLERNGGPTKTHALLPGSPAIDANSSILGCNLLSGTDQRGVSRLQDGNGDGLTACDVGAYEAITPIVVKSLADPGDGTTCTLRQAIAAANTNSAQGTCTAGVYDATQPDRITFGVTGTITLTAGALMPSQSVMIDGPGADRLILNGGGTAPVIQFQNGAAANTYVLAGVRLVNGYAGLPWASGASYSGTDDTVAFDRCFFTAEAAEFTGNPTCIYASGGRIEIARTTCTSSSTTQTAMSFFGSVVEMADSTVVAPSHAGVYVETGSKLSLVSCTFKGGDVSGLLVDGTSSATYRANVFAGFHPNFTISGSGTSLGDNVSSDASGNLVAAGDLTNTEPLLGVLAYNGGAVPTVNLKAGSPAIDHIPAARTRRTADQRGFPRPVGAGDSGAIERVVGGDVNRDGGVNVADVFYLINFLFAGGPVPLGEPDASGDGDVNVADVFYLINFLFAGGAAPL